MLRSPLVGLGRRARRARCNRPYGVVLIRGHTLGVIDAILRQLSHYAYHVSHIVQIAEERRGAEWQTV